MVARSESVCRPNQKIKVARVNLYTMISYAKLITLIIMTSTVGRYSHAAALTSFLVHSLIGTVVYSGKICVTK